MKKNLDKTYNPKDIEKALYSNWEKRGYFHAEVDKSKKPYTIVIPPPNITGQLHMGHALDNTLQDILIRMKRMQGYSTLWQPGTDHASIATEIKILEKLDNQGIKKEDLTREEFLEKAWDWKETYASKIIEQLKKLGASCDWQRTRFTLDEGCNEAVFNFFKKLYKDGYIYKDEKIIHWCPLCKTTISDAEVEYIEKEGYFYHIKYILDDSDKYMEVATTRPETLFGDTAVIVHPEDKRYSKFVGKNVILPIIGKKIPIIADNYVDMEFGTGVVKVTPAHDPNDFEVGKRHNLESITVMNDDATMNEKSMQFSGLDRYECRKRLVEELKKQGLLIKIERHVHNVGTHERCSTDIEPLAKAQWFVKMAELAKPAIEAVEKDELHFVPKRFEKIYLHWLNNIRDWCISRQLWWGHRIPVFYCDDCGHLTLSNKHIEKCEKCGSIHIHQDEDTLDTWFSSALWPHSTLGWPNDTEEFKYFYPTNTLVTGYDIIFFWVVRMVFAGIYNTGKLPFDTVLIHGLVRDSQGRKMSKSLGNGIDPLEVIENYGADALRYTIVTGNAPGADMRYYESRVEASRNFANKIWNASRFILMNMDKLDNLESDLQIEDKWILSRLNRVIFEVTENMEKFELGIAVDKLNSFIWDEFCDWYIEMVKPRLFSKDETTNAALNTLKKVLIDSLKLLHPYMPFITDEIYRNLTDDDTIMIQKWPTVDDKNYISEAEQVIEAQNVIKSIRNLRANMNIHPTKRCKLFIRSKFRDVFSTEFFKKLSFSTHVEFTDKELTGDEYVSVVSENSVVYLVLSELVDFEKEVERLNTELLRLEDEIKRCNNMLSNEKFLSKAPLTKVEEEKSKLDKYKVQLDEVKKLLEKYSK